MMRAPGGRPASQRSVAAKVSARTRPWALPTWVGIMRRIEPPGGDGDFAAPEGVVTRLIDPETGLLATDDCPTTLSEVFLAGTEPTEECHAHGGILHWFRGLFGR